MIQELFGRRERNGERRDSEDGTTTEDDERRATLKSRRKDKMSRGKLNEERRRKRRARENREIDLEGQTEMGSNAEGGRMRRDGRRRCMRKNFTREPANPRERFASSARLPAVSVSCAIPYAALVRSDDCARTRPDRSTLVLFESGIARESAPVAWPWSSIPISLPMETLRVRWSIGRSNYKQPRGAARRLIMEIATRNRRTDSHTLLSFVINRSRGIIRRMTSKWRGCKIETVWQLREKLVYR